MNTKISYHPLRPTLSSTTSFRKYVQQQAGTVKTAHLTWVEPIVSVNYGQVWGVEYRYTGEHSSQFLKEFFVKFDQLTDLHTINIFSNKLDRITLDVNYTELEEPSDQTASTSTPLPTESKKQLKYKAWLLRSKQMKQGIGFVQGETLYPTTPKPIAEVEPTTSGSQLSEEKIEKVEPTPVVKATVPPSKAVVKPVKKVTPPENSTTPLRKDEQLLNQRNQLLA